MPTRLGTVRNSEINKVYDPACGLGSLLLKAEKVLGRNKVRQGFFGQKKNITTYNLEREFIAMLCDQGYEYLLVHTETDLLDNLRKQLEALNNYAFYDSE